MPKPFKKDGKWAIRVNWKEENADGVKYFQKGKQGFEGKRQAKEWANDFLYKIKNQEITSPNKIPSFADYFDKWTKIYRFPNITHVTQKRYIAIHKLLLKNFGSKKINKISRSMYQQFLNEYSKTHAPSTVSMTRSIIKASLDSAVADKIITSNFALNTTAKGNKSKKLKVTYPTVEQLNSILSEAMKRKKPSAPTYYMIITAILTGMRLAEIGGLTWDNIDFKKKTFNIVRAYDRKSKTPEKPFKPLKNEYSERTIRVNQSLLDILLELKGNNPILVFGNSKYTVPYSNGVKHSLKSILKSLNLDLMDFHFHSLRHAHVALLHHNHIEWYAISKRLGHKDLATTLKEYAYLAEEDKIKNDERIEQDLSNFVSRAENVQKFKN